MPVAVEDIVVFEHGSVIVSDFGLSSDISSASEVISTSPELV